MDQLPGFIVPDTDIIRETRYPLLLLCAPLAFLNLIEPDPELEADGELDLFINAGLCQAHTPVPLGNDRSRFQRLIDDIRLRRDDYAAQLATLTVAAMSAPTSERSGEARHQIVSSLLGQNSQPGNRSGSKETDLWQSRLVLAIGEILDRETEDLHRDLELLDAQEMEMIRSLQGEEGENDDDPLTSLDQAMTLLNQSRLGSGKTRFNAWLNIMSAGPVPEPTVWIFSSREMGDLFFEFFIPDTTAPLPILRIPLPRRIDASPVYIIEQIKQFHARAHDVISAIAADLNRISSLGMNRTTEPDNLLPSHLAPIERWESLLDEWFPSSSHGRASLTFYLVAQRSLPGLLFKSADPVHAGAGRQGLIAVLD